MTTTLRLDLRVTALSSIKHGGQILGTTTMLRRETIVAADGSTRVQIPIISGNALRAVLRRTGEAMLRDVLGYEGRLSYPAAIALIGGGRLTKTTSNPLSGQRLLDLRNKVPLISLFGASTAGAIIEGCLDVGKLLPHLRETTHLVDAGRNPPTVLEATQQETYTRNQIADSPHLLTAIAPDASQSDDSPLVFEFETFPTGTRFSGWLQVNNATDLEVAFLRDMVDTYSANAHIGGRTAIGHGRVRVEHTEHLLRGDPQPCNWRDELTAHRADALAALEDLG